jgi:hypothetical protein
MRPSGSLTGPSKQVQACPTVPRIYSVNLLLLACIRTFFVEAETLQSGIV